MHLVFYYIYVSDLIVSKFKNMKPLFQIFFVVVCFVLLGMRPGPTGHDSGTDVALSKRIPSPTATDEMLLSGQKPPFKPNNLNFPNDLHYNWDSLLRLSLADSDLVTRIYDNTGNILQEKYRAKGQSVWMDTYRSRYIYGVQGRLDSTYWEQFQAGQWWNLYRDTYTYDNQDNLLVMFDERWNGASYDGYYRITYSYDQMGRVASEIHEEQNTGVLSFYQQYQYVWDNSDNLVELLTLSWTGTEWINLNRVTTVFDASNNPLTVLRQIWIGSSWKDDRKSTYTWDTKGNMLTFLRQIFTSNQWQNITRMTYSYNPTGKPLVTFTEIWRQADSSWYTTFRQSNAYEVNGDMTASLGETMDTVTGTWTNSSWLRYFYDQKGNSTDCNYEKWSNNQWIPGLGTLYVYAQREIIYLINGYHQFKAGFTSYFNGINDYSKSSSFRITPNPAGSYITFENKKNGFIGLRMTVYDVSGRIHLEQLLSGDKSMIDVSNLQTGVYLVKISGNQGSLFGRFIKK